LRRKKPSAGAAAADKVRPPLQARAASVSLVFLGNSYHLPNLVIKANLGPEEVQIATKEKSNLECLNSMTNLKLPNTQMGVKGDLRAKQIFMV